MILEISLHARNELNRVTFVDVEVANKPDVRAEIRSLYIEQPVVITKGPIPMDEVVRMILTERVLNAIWRAETAVKITEEISTKLNQNT